MDPTLPSWKDGNAKSAVVAFVQSITTPGAGYVPPAERIAAFDNDGTMWVEQPLPPQFDFMIQTWVAEVRENPALAQQQPYKAILERDASFFAGLETQDPGVVTALLQALARSWTGTTPEHFDDHVHAWLKQAKQPKFGCAYTNLVYKPMLELFAYLTANEFRVFICSGGGRDFMRVFAEEAWGIHKENVIGSAPDYEYKDGRLLRTEKVLGGVALGPGKPEHIYARTGRLPLFAGGNGDVDIEMLEAARFALLINHDDEQREYSYTRGAEKALAKAKECGWTIASMKEDWAVVF